MAPYKTQRRLVAKVWFPNAFDKKVSLFIKGVRKWGKGTQWGAPLRGSAGPHCERQTGAPVPEAPQPALGSCPQPGPALP